MAVTLDDDDLVGKCEFSRREGRAAIYQCDNHHVLISR